MSTIFGLEVVSSLDLNVRPGKQSEESVQYNKNKTIKAFKEFISNIEKGGRTQPTLNNLVPFHIFKLFSKLKRNYMIADREYYKKMTNYHFDTQISPLKTMIAKRATRNTILG